MSPMFPITNAFPPCVLLQLKDETKRTEEEIKEEKERAKKKKQTEKEWEATREQRVGTWRDFMDKKGGR